MSQPPSRADSDRPDGAAADPTGGERSEIITAVVPVVPLPSGDALRPQPYLIALSGPEAGRLLSLAGRSVLGGRGEAEVELQDPSLTPRHCAIEVDSFGDVYLEPLDDGVATFVNDRPVTGVVRLADGDRLRLGASTLLKFALQDKLEADLQETLYDAALRDGLTRLYNRRYLTERCAQEFAYASRKGEPLALLLLDLDHFKTVNDRLGHLAGDQVLRLLAQQLAAAIRDEDVCGRMGGEEFAVLVHGQAAPRAMLLAERLRFLVARSPYRWQGEPLPLTVSVGLAGLPDSTIASATELMARADEALYRAKRAGRNTTRVYHGGHLA